MPERLRLSQFQKGLAILHEHYMRTQQIPKNTQDSWYAVLVRNGVTNEGWQRAIQDYIAGNDDFPRSVAPLVRMAATEWQPGQPLPPDVRKLADQLHEAEGDQERTREIARKIMGRQATTALQRKG